ncbi:MAG: Holliday junction resolvase RuvX [Bdellovibrionales bacterium]|nr:Holliday junction resolvase RuvX [Bdellovibrionales bacterium]
MMSPRRSLPGAVLALDWGGAKVGYATCDETGTVITPRGRFARKSRHRPWQLLPADLQELRRLIRNFEPALLLLGLPLHADGQESDASALARQLALELHRELKLPVELVPEILTSWASRGASDEDAAAAALIIEDYLKGDS